MARRRTASASTAGVTPSWSAPRALRFGFTALVADQQDRDLTELPQRRGRWHDPIRALVDAADDEPIPRNDIVELPPLDARAAARRS